jgi:predicted RNA-binding protein with PIN domain
MMRYLIDGYNLLHATGHLSRRGGRFSLEGARRALLQALADRFAEGAVTVVFDARHAPPGVRPERDDHGVHIVYTTEGEADDLIEDLIRKESAPQYLTLISNDHRLREAARLRGCRQIECVAFFADLGSRHPPPVAPPAEAPDKPDGVSMTEVEDWIRIFGEVTDEPPP